MTDRCYIIPRPHPFTEAQIATALSTGDVFTLQLFGQQMALQPGDLNPMIPVGPPGSVPSTGTILLYSDAQYGGTGTVQDAGPAAVPEPASLVLGGLAIALGTVSALIRRRHAP